MRIAIGRMSRRRRIVPRPRHVIVPHMQLSQNEVLGLNHPKRTPLGAALSEGKPVTRGCSQGWLPTPLPHRFHTTPFHASSKLNFTTSQVSCNLPALSLLHPCFGNSLISALWPSCCRRLSQSVAAQKPRIKRPYGLRDLPSLPSSRKIQFVRPWPAS